MAQSTGWIMRIISLVVLALGLAAGGAQTGNSEQAAKPADDKGKKQAVANDLYGDPLPEGAVARLGTVRFRHPGSAEAFAYSPDGKYLASAGFSVGACIWDAISGRPLHQLTDNFLCWSVAFSADSKTLLLGSDYVRAIDVATGKELRRFAGPGSLLAAVSPDGKLVAVTELLGQSTVVLHDFATGKELRQLKWKNGKRQSDYRASLPLAFSPDSETLAVGTVDGVVRLWDGATGKELRRFAGGEKPVLSVAFSPNGKFLASAGEDAMVRLWDVKTGKELRRLKAEEGVLISVAFAPDGKLLASAAFGGMVRFWDADTGKEIRKWFAGLGGVFGAAFSPDGSVYAVNGWHGLHRWDTKTAKEINPIAAHSGRVEALQFTADGKTLFSCGKDCRALEWDLATGLQRRQLFGEPPGPPATVSLWTTSDLAADGKLLAYQKQELYTPGDKPDPWIRVRDLVTGKELPALKVPAAHVKALKFSPNGKVLVSTGEDGISLWEMASAKKLHHFPKEQVGSSAIAFSPNNKLLAWSGADGMVRFWDIATAKEVRSWQGPRGARCLIFSPDGTMMAGGNRDTVFVWDTDTGKELKRWQEVDAQLHSLVFSPSGRCLAAATKRTRRGREVVLVSEIFVWEVPSGHSLVKIELPSFVDLSLAFAPDSRTLASGSGDSSILLWDMTGGAQLAKPAALTPAELAGLWSALADVAPKANRALWVLALAPNQSMALLKKRLAPVVPADPKEIAKLVVDLDSEQYAVRQNAGKALESLGESAEKTVRESLAGNVTLEVRRQLQQLIEKREKDGLRKLRAIETLELIATAEARELLASMAKDSPNPRVALGAARALGRLKKRG